MMNRSVRIGVAVFLLGALGVLPAHAGHVLWTDALGDGDFNNAGNWNAGLPQAGDWVHVAATVPGATLTGDFPAVLGDLYVGSYEVGVGSLTQSDYTLNVSNYLCVGYHNGGTVDNVYDLSGGTLRVTEGVGELRIGNGSPGVMTVSNADHAALVECKTLYVGHSGTGTLTLTGNSESDPVRFTSTSLWNVGLWGTGHMEVNHADVTHGGSWIIVGDGGGNGTVDVNSGTLRSLGSAADGAILGLNTGTGTWNQNGGLADLDHMFVHVGTWGGTGTLNLNGGTLRTSRVTTADTAVSSTVHFNGGALKASADSPDFIGADPAKGSGFMQLLVQAGGAVIDSDVYSVAVDEALHEDPASPGGGLTKLGAGSLTLSGANTYAGPTTVVEGTLKGACALAGDLNVRSGATLEAGASIGGLSIGGDLTLDGTLLVEYDGAADPAIDLLSVGGDLDLTAASLDFSTIEGGSPLAAPSYVFLTYAGMRTGVVALENIDNLPDGYTVAYDVGGGQNVALTAIPEPSVLALLVCTSIGAIVRRRP